VNGNLKTTIGIQFLLSLEKYYGEQLDFPKSETNTMNQIPAPVELIERQIYLIRGQKVMLDKDLANLYRTSTKAFNQAVHRNRDRFPEDFMFQFTKEELENWRSQIVTSNPSAKMSLRRAPYAFTKQGVAMLSSVLHSQRAIQMNILIIRVFVKLREILATHKDLARKND
jgi:hypothetical protein